MPSFGNLTPNPMKYSSNPSSTPKRTVLGSWTLFVRLSSVVKSYGIKGSLYFTA
jgi:hypothetical protein